MTGIFISYASEDHEDVERQVVVPLRNAGYEPWFDRAELRGGTQWEEEIWHRLHDSSHVVLCLSKAWERRGYFYREARLAQSHAMEYPFGYKYIFPVLLRDSDRIDPFLRDQLACYQWCGPKELISAIQAASPQATTPRAAVERPATGHISVTHLLTEHVEGLAAFVEEGRVIEYERHDKTPSFYYPEAAGWAILHYLFLYDHTTDARHMEAARACARWVCSPQVLTESGGVSSGVPVDGAAGCRGSFEGASCTFDTAICLKGLCALIQRGESEFVESATRMAEFVRRQLQSRSALDPSRPSAQARWSQQDGPHLAQAAAALVQFAKLEGTCGDECAKEILLQLATERCVQWAREQHPTGRYETSPNETNLHAHAYAASAMLEVGTALGNDKLVSSAIAAVRWALGTMQNGRLPQIVRDDTAVQSAPRNDAVAQVLSLGTELWRRGDLDEIHQRYLPELAAHLMRARRDGKELGLPSAFGTSRFFGFGHIESGENAERTSFWVNSFALEALVAYRLVSLLEKMTVIILAGGTGARAWPLACMRRPKALARILPSGSSLLQETLHRFSGMVAPERIRALVGAGAVPEARTQCEEAGLRARQILEETEPVGTTRALDQAIEQTGLADDAFVVVSMVDNLIEPRDDYYRALKCALLTADEEDTIVSIGKTLHRDTQGTFPKDSRFGYMVYDENRKLGLLPAYDVELFIEKPAEPRDWELIGRRARAQNRNSAWECGTLVCRVATYKAARQVVESRPTENGDTSTLAKLLQASFGSEGSPLFRVAVVPLSAETTFDDVGAPGPHYLETFRKKPSERNGNVCLGDGGRIRLLQCTGCIVIADGRDIRVYGLRDHLVVDSAITNSALVIPLEHLDAMPWICTELERKWAPFRHGWPATKLNVDNDPYLFGSLECSVLSSDPTAGYEGLTVVYKCRDIKVVRGNGCLTVLNKKYPLLANTPEGPDDFEILSRREEQEPLLVRHLLDVARIAEDLGDNKNLGLTAPALEMLRLVSLYHDFGGTLDQEQEQRESKLAMQFRARSGLDRRLLDSAIVAAIANHATGSAAHAWPDVRRLVDDNLNSCVDFLERRGVKDQAGRDLSVMVLSTQGAPESMAVFLKGYRAKGPLARKDVEQIYGLLKTADSLVAARWKRKREQALLDQTPSTSGIALPEPFAATCAFVSAFLRRADIEPFSYLEAMLLALTPQRLPDRPEDVVLGDRPTAQIVRELQGDMVADQLMVADRIFLYWYARGATNHAARGATIRQYLAATVPLLLEDHRQGDPGATYDLQQLLRMPAALLAFPEFAPETPSDSLLSILKKAMAQHSEVQDAFEDLWSECMGARRSFVREP